ncbi:MAG: hypothetical protein GYB67_07565 [Chloroflexi bacterium]|nr:hypothetical protein [Chloroflexota bacterium]
MTADTSKKEYQAPTIEEIGPLDRFVNEGANADANDGKKFYITPDSYIFFETPAS